MTTNVSVPSGSYTYQSTATPRAADPRQSIAIDVRYRTESGASSYVLNLMRLLLQSDYPKRYRIVLVKYAHQRFEGADELDAIICPAIGVLAQLLWDQLALPALLSRNRIALYHCCKLFGPLSSPCPTIRMAHSITGRYRDEIFQRDGLRTMYWDFADAFYRRSSIVIAVSEFVRQFLLERARVPASKIVVIHNGVDPQFRRLDPDERAQHALTLPFTGPFLLVVGNLFPVKNQLTAVRAFGEISRRLPGLHLVLAGKTNHPYGLRVRAAVEEDGLAQRVHFLGHVSADKLVALYNEAVLLVTPSLTEGFGIAVAEAMACGLPVIASDRGSIGEIGGDAVRLIDDPENITSWVDNIREVIDDPALREDMSRRAIVGAARFSWPRTVEQTLTVYDALLGGSVLRAPR